MALWMIAHWAISQDPEFRPLILRESAAEALTPMTPQPSLPQFRVLGAGLGLQRTSPINNHMTRVEAHSLATLPM